MKILLRAAHIINPDSEFHLQTHNILIENGRIAYIGADAPEADEEIKADGLMVSAGWVDLHSFVGEPGLEYKEDLESVAAAAAAGGFTDILCLPNVEPVVQTRGAVNYLKQKTAGLPVTLHPAAALTVDTAGKDLTEMIDLHQAGALAFTDGTKPLQGAEVLVKALQYVQQFDGLLMNRPEHTGLTYHGQMHEGHTSTLLGMKGIPALAEEIMVNRDLQLLNYTGGRLHFSLISTAASVAAIRRAKAEGLQVTCDVASYQTAFTDATMQPFDTNYKVAPPFRATADAEAIKKGLQDGTIDALVSAHIPHDTESKKLEFDLAEFGIANLETAFAIANTSLSDVLSTEEIIAKFTVGPRQVLKMPLPRIQEGEAANLTIFSATRTWTPAPDKTKSKSKCSPFYGQELTGQVIGIINKGHLVLNNSF